MEQKTHTDKVVGAIVEFIVALFVILTLKRAYILYFTLTKSYSGW